MRPARRLSVSLAILIAAMGLAASADAAHPIYRARADGPALRGYDTVAYFTLQRAVKGSPEHSHEWRDTVWHFANAEHRALFVANPEKYAPQFGGYCAYAVSQSQLYEGNPTVFEIVEDKLYFNNNSSVMAVWRTQHDRLIGVAEKLFPQIVRGRKAKPNSAHPPARAR